MLREPRFPAFLLVRVQRVPAIITSIQSRWESNDCGIPTPWYIIHTGLQKESFLLWEWDLSFSIQTITSSTKVSSRREAPRTKQLARGAIFNCLTSLSAHQSLASACVEAKLLRGGKREREWKGHWRRRCGVRRRPNPLTEPSQTHGVQTQLWTGSKSSAWS